MCQLKAEGGKRCMSSKSILMDRSDLSEETQDSNAQKYENLFDLSLPFSDKVDLLREYAKNEKISVEDRVNTVTQLAIVGDVIQLNLLPAGKMSIANKLSLDVIGSIVEGHIGSVLNTLIPGITAQEKRQSFPDLYYQHGTSNEKEIEIKSYNGASSPGFDVANFDSFVDTVITNPNRLNAKYLVSSYRISPDGNSFTIDTIQMKSVWEICGPVPMSSKRPIGTINAQVKRNIVYNIRPVSSKRSAFGSKEELINSLLVSVEHFCKDKSHENHKNRIAGLKSLLA